MFQGKMKAVTFSYDDGATQDKRLVEIFNKYNLKATFNLNSELLGDEDYLIREGVKVSFVKNKPEEVAELYKGHEVAVHTLTHPHLTDCSDEEIIRQVEQDRLALSELVGYEVVGMAYPGGGVNHDERVKALVRERTGIRYARGVVSSNSFEPCDDLFSYTPTLSHHGGWKNLFEMGEKFLALSSDTPKVFYVWGHSFEFDIYPERWEIFEEFCRMMAGKEDIFYGTNKEILLPFA
jgi:peptidoglycan/xylan/chitin deacetylase (PgdA/CDA1 family)